MNSEKLMPRILSLFADWTFTVLAIVFCAFAAYSFAEHRIDPGMTQADPPRVMTAELKRAALQAPGTGDGREGFRMASAVATAWVVLWGMFAFTGDPGKRRVECFKFAYFFVIAAFAVFALPPLLKSQAIGSEPIGIVSGCVTDTKASEQIQCSPRDAAPAGKPPTILNNQWLVNIGGTLMPQTAPPAAPCVGDEEGSCKLGSKENRAKISGGLVVPLPFVIIAMIGGAISLSRRIPEIQKSSEPSYVGTPTQPACGAPEARDRLVFQMMQFISAPMIAVVAYQVIRPDSDASAAGLAFMCGFGSEAILLIIRGFAEGVRPRVPATIPATADAATGAISGIVNGKDGPVANAEVAVTGSSVKVRTDSQGSYALHGVPAGVQKISATADGRTVTVAVTVPAGGAVTQALISLDG